MSVEEEKEMVLRNDLEEKIREYYSSCFDNDAEFVSALTDIVYNATDNAVMLPD